MKKYEGKVSCMHKFMHFMCNVLVVVVLVVVVVEMVPLHVVSEALTSRISPVEYSFRELNPLSRTRTTAFPFLSSTFFTQPSRLELFTNTRSPTCTLNSHDSLGCVFPLVRDGQESPHPPTVKKVSYHSAQVLGALFSQVLRQSNVFTVVDASNVIMQTCTFCEHLCVLPMCIFVVLGRFQRDDKKFAQINNHRYEKIRRQSLLHAQVHVFYVQRTRGACCCCGNGSFARRVRGSD